VVPGLITALAVFVVKPGVVKACFGECLPLLFVVVGEVRTAVTVVALELFSKKKRLASSRGGGDGLRFSMF
jgi:hypothetical protein